ncbi:hypothetical protein A3E45_04560 [Candidatus Daviesbacteria bacterium RIFCSPHIGHO2_12_FULL_43_11]|uniref:Uncharacterized protein n=1 Tax=Candidatus Daviesbacteria bacterium RIFCSPHIGHO2_12_FULL_43_11 TaxID=1797780 RepID=A0A1F5K098_9BACT|nr:MAG: hypothetical protein A3E45_04560 [Candidatus Daviesbacteria bacterium RIFCSPHIGHO2_12_FULL_43_11]
MPKCDGEHKFSLRISIKPELREFKIFDFTGINKVDNFTAIHTIAGKSVRMPGQDSASITFFNSLNHGIENRATRNLGRLFLDKLLSDI